jgi:hypothetical protein
MPAYSYPDGPVRLQSSKQFTSADPGFEEAISYAVMASQLFVDAGSRRTGWLQETQKKRILLTSRRKEFILLP